MNGEKMNHICSVCNAKMNVDGETFDLICRDHVVESVSTPLQRVTLK